MFTFIYRREISKLFDKLSLYPTKLVCIFFQDPVFRNKENVNKNYNPGDNVYYNILNRIKQQDKTENISTLSDTTISSSLKDGNYTYKFFNYFYE